MIDTRTKRPYRAVAMTRSGLLRRGSWFVLIGAAVSGCTDEDHSFPDGQPFGTYEVRLELTLSPKPSGCPGPATYANVWWTSMDFPVDDPALTGWFSVSGVDVDGTRRDVATTTSAPLSGRTDSAGLTLDPFDVHLTGLAGMLRLSSVVLRPGATPESFVGDLAGELDERSGDQVCTYDVRGTLAGQLDVTAPRHLPVATQLSPFDPIALDFVEPVLWDGTTVDVSPSSMFAVEPIVDTRPGFAIGATIRPMQLWPADASLGVTLPAVTDAAGNVASFELAVQTLPPPASNINLGLESVEPFGWTTAGEAYLASTFDCAETQGMTHVTAVEGASMLLLQPSAKLVGFLQPSGATRLQVAIGLCDTSPVRVLQDVDRGFELELITASERIRLAGSADLPHPTSSDAHWTGFGMLDVALPASAAGGFWLRATSIDPEAPVHFTSVLFDAVSFSSP
jgi:hypothetical protein